MKHETALRQAAFAADQPTYDFTGTWTNELGSTMSVTAANGSLSGSYTSVVSEQGGTITGALTGWSSGLLISIAVQWESLAAITAWVGQLVAENNVATIVTLWQMTTAIANPGNPDELWNSVLAGTDSFVRT